MDRKIDRRIYRKIEREMIEKDRRDKEREIERKKDRVQQKMWFKIIIIKIYYLNYRACSNYARMLYTVHFI